MKLKYTKPAMVMERFELSQTIASGGCGANPHGSLGDPNLLTKNTCGWDMGNLIVWTGAEIGCEVEWGADEAFDGVCYNNPDGGYTIFSSY